MPEDATISPRGIPPIRTDWLADVAWRLAALGVDTLGRLADDEVITLTDHVDGERWRIEAFRVSEAVASWVELDGDLFLPTDEGAATMRVAFALVPTWDLAAGARVIETRVEVGPRGAVTFDPENWMLRIPDPVTERPAIEGVVGGRWEGVPARQHAALSLDAIAGKRVGFGELVEIAEGADTWIATLPVYGAPPKQGFLARLRGGESLGDPEAMVVVSAAGPLAVEPAELLAGEDFPEIGVVDRVDAGAGSVQFVGARLEAAGGSVVIRGSALRVAVQSV